MPNLFIRSIKAEVVERLKVEAHKRNLNLAQYVRLLLLLHLRARHIVVHGPPYKEAIQEIKKLLDDLDLLVETNPITVREG